MADNTTQATIVASSGTGFVINVAACNLLPSVAVKDFEVFDDGLLMNNADWTKLNQVQLQYSGTAIPASTLTVRRKTLVQRVQELVYASRLNTPNYEAELNTIHRILNDFRSANTFSSVPPGVIDAAYGAGWSGDTVNAASRKNVYDKFVSVDAAAAARLADVTTLAASLATTITTVNNKVDINGAAGTITVTDPARKSALPRAVSAAYVLTQHPVLLITKSSLSLPHNITTLVDNYLTPVINDGGFYSVASNGKITMPATGTYEVSIIFNNSALPKAQLYANVYKQGAQQTSLFAGGGLHAQDTMRQIDGKTYLSYNAGEYLELAIFQLGASPSTIAGDVLMKIELM